MKAERELAKLRMPLFEQYPGMRLGAKSAAKNSLTHAISRDQIPSGPPVHRKFLLVACFIFSG